MVRTEHEANVGLECGSTTRRAVGNIRGDWFDVATGGYPVAIVPAYLPTCPPYSHTGLSLMTSLCKVHDKQIERVLQLNLKKWFSSTTR